MPLWLCDWDRCEQPAVQRARDCFLCVKHLCRTHLQGQWHKYPKLENWPGFSVQYVATEVRQMNELCRRLDDSKLCTRASLLRGSHRSRLAKTSPPPVEARDYIIRSEVAAMNSLRKHTRIPSPEVFDWVSESDLRNPLGKVGYNLMEKVEGELLDWQLATLPQKEKFMQQLIDHAAFRLECGGPIGPFGSSLEAARVMVESYLAMAASGEVATAFPIDVYLILPEGKFSLKHADDKGDHILANKAYDIVSIVDWEWCHTVSEEGRNDLTNHVTEGRKVQRLFFSLGAASECYNDHKSFGSLFSASWEEWKSKALEDGRTTICCKCCYRAGLDLRACCFHSSLIPFI
ncbi:hypothetical protein F5Y10DRAFT_282365 [Nemania abortiva]|nr:hypothetical protein F5Y10DRAFT_282365 [Nemania abortiva]